MKRTIGFLVLTLYFLASSNSAFALDKISNITSIVGFEGEKVSFRSKTRPNEVKVILKNSDNIQFAEAAVTRGRRIRRGSSQREHSFVLPDVSKTRGIFIEISGGSIDPEEAVAIPTVVYNDSNRANSEGNINQVGSANPDPFGLQGPAGNTLANVDTAFSGNNTHAGTEAFNGPLTINSTVNFGTNSIIQGPNPFVFEGGTINLFQTTLSIADPTADQTITIPNRSGSFRVDGSTNNLILNAGTSYDASAFGPVVSIQDDGQARSISLLPNCIPGSITTLSFLNATANNVTIVDTETGISGTINLANPATNFVANTNGEALTLACGAGGNLHEIGRSVL